MLCIRKGEPATRIGILLSQSSVSAACSSWSVTNVPMCCRDGGLKRAKVKDTFKEEQQKLYSKMLVGTQEDRSRS